MFLFWIKSTWTFSLFPFFFCHFWNDNEIKYAYVLVVWNIRFDIDFNFQKIKKRANRQFKSCLPMWKGTFRIRWMQLLFFLASSLSSEKKNKTKEFTIHIIVSNLKLFSSFSIHRTNFVLVALCIAMISKKRTAKMPSHFNVYTDQWTRMRRKQNEWVCKVSDD